MLKEISCDKFIEKGVMRKPTQLHQGLNTVIGHQDGSNSIGKSTLLLIIDFVFGGSDYVKKALDVLDNVGNHVIHFCFEFDGKTYYFSRSTLNHTVVNVCDSHYHTLKTLSKEEYCELLKDFYGLDFPDLNFRETISPFIRVWGRATLDENKPLRAQAGNVPDKQGIAMLLKLFNRYSEISQQQAIYNETKERKEAFRKAQDFQYIATVENRTIYKDNVKKINTLEAELRSLTQNSAAGLLDLDSFQAEQLAQLRLRLSNAKRQRTKLMAQKKSFEEENSPLKQKVQKDFETLHISEI